ncbi:MAG: hypothetical protein J5I92_15295 [Thiogranum sp.]|nr:hypothetical protein [Thiogranum sp.]
MDSDSDAEAIHGDAPGPAEAGKIRMLPSVGVPDAKIVARWLLPYIIEQLMKEYGDEADATGSSSKE